MKFWGLRSQAGSSFDLQQMHLPIIRHARDFFSQYRPMDLFWLYSKVDASIHNVRGLKVWIEPCPLELYRRGMPNNYPDKSQYCGAPEYQSYKV